MGRRIAGLLGLLFLVSAVYTGRHFIDDIDKLVKLQRVRGLTSAVLISLLNAETGQRGYIITDNQDYLIPYRSNVGSISLNVQALEAALLNTDQVSHAVDLQRLIRDKLDEMAYTISRRQVSLGAAVDQVNQHLGKNLMDHIREHLSVIELWADRSTSAGNANATFYARGAFVSMLLSLAFGMIATARWDWWARTSRATV